MTLKMIRMEVALSTIIGAFNCSKRVDSPAATGAC
jgi:hypothetical protein